MDNRITNFAYLLFGDIVAREGFTQSKGLFRGNHKESIPHTWAKIDYTKGFAEGEAIEE